jgi:hypothetical protein
MGQSKSLTYINELIANIETFQIKVERFTSKPEKWVYRVYLDENIFNLDKLIHNLISENEVKNKKIIKKNPWRPNKKLAYSKSLHNKTDNNLINELDFKATTIRDNIVNAYDVLLFISKLIRKYIDMILAAKETRYDNIEIMIYSNPDLQIHLGTDSKKAISGLMATYGTMMRFHPCIDKDVRAVIMRNCSLNLTPLDLIIQNYWLEALHDKEFMEYVNTTYDFTADSNSQYRGEWYKTIYNDSRNTKHTRASKIRHFGYDRAMAGAISVKLNSNGYNTYKHYSNVFIKLYHKIQDSLSKSGTIFYLQENEKLYSYGIDEALIHFMFPDLRSGSYRHKDIKNPQGLENKTFALELDRGNVSTCHKCDKKSFDTMLDSALGKLPVKKIDNDKETDKKTDKTIKKTIKKINKADTLCCLNNIYMRDTGFYNLNFKINDSFHMGDILSSLRALPFYKLKINSWYMPQLSLYSNVLDSIMFINKYHFALKDKHNIPKSVRRTKKISSTGNDIGNMGGGTSDNSTMSTNKKQEQIKTTDKHLVLCNVRNPNINQEIKKYLEGVKLAYHLDNFYPILIYPKQVNILSYYPENNAKDKKNQKTISIHKMLELVKHKHGFVL